MPDILRLAQMWLAEAAENRADADKQRLLGNLDVADRFFVRSSTLESCARRLIREVERLTDA
jgi:hypothetical protein